MTIISSCWRRLVCVKWWQTLFKKTPSLLLDNVADTVSEGIQHRQDNKLGMIIQDITDCVCVCVCVCDYQWETKKRIIVKFGGTIIFISQVAKKKVILCDCNFFFPTRTEVKQWMNVPMMAKWSKVGFVHTRPLCHLHLLLLHRYHLLYLMEFTVISTRI